jgi:hypothetical protein
MIVVFILRARKEVPWNDPFHNSLGDPVPPTPTHFSTFSSSLPIPFTGILVAITFASDKRFGWVDTAKPEGARREYSSTETRRKLQAPTPPSSNGLFPWSQ